MGLEVPFDVRLSAALNDVTGLFILIPILALGFGVAFGVTHQILRVLPQLRYLGYILAGFVAFWAIDYTLFKVMNGMHVLAVTRTSIGAVMLYLTGALGGYLFVRLLPDADTAASDLQ